MRRNTNKKLKAKIGRFKEKEKSDKVTKKNKRMLLKNMNKQTTIIKFTNVQCKKKYELSCNYKPSSLWNLISYHWKASSEPVLR